MIYASTSRWSVNPSYIELWYNKENGYSLMYQGFRRLSLEFIEALICIIRMFVLFLNLENTECFKECLNFEDIPIISLSIIINSLFH
jgi:hypothetical protein